MGRRPKEDPADRKARLRERRMSDLERRRASEDQAGGLTADLRAVYGSRSAPKKPIAVTPLPGPRRPSAFGM